MHDATTGFHDIKPLPAFVWSSNGISSGVLVAGFLLLLLVGYLINRLRKSRSGPAIIPPTAKQIAHSQIDSLTNRLQSREIIPRTFAAELSEITRNYLGSVLSFPAIDLTANEIKQATPQILRAALPLVGHDRCTSWTEELVAFLLRCDRIAFADDSETIFSAEDAHFQDLASEAKERISQLDTWIAKEVERKRGVIGEADRRGGDRAYAVS